MITQSRVIMNIVYKYAVCELEDNNGCPDVQGKITRGRSDRTLLHENPVFMFEFGMLTGSENIENNMQLRAPNYDKMVT